MQPTSGKKIYVKQIEVYANCAIYFIRFTMSTGEKFMHGGGQCVGRVKNCAKKTLKLYNDDFIRKVEWKVGQLHSGFPLQNGVGVVYVKFTTSKGKILESGTSGYCAYMWPGKKDVKLEATQKNQILGMHGKAGKMLDSLGFWMVKDENEYAK